MSDAMEGDTPSMETVGPIIPLRVRAPLAHPPQPCTPPLPLPPAAAASSPPPGARAARRPLATSHPQPHARTLPAPLPLPLQQPPRRLAALLLPRCRRPHTRAAAVQCGGADDPFSVCVDCVCGACMVRVVRVVTCLSFMSLPEGRPCRCVATCAARSSSSRAVWFLFARML
jgi:hypothetical protein